MKINNIFSVGREVVESDSVVVPINVESRLQVPVLSLVLLWDTVVDTRIATKCLRGHSQKEIKLWWCKHSCGDILKSFWTGWLLQSAKTASISHMSTETCSAVISYLHVCWSCERHVGLQQIGEKDRTALLFTFSWNNSFSGTPDLGQLSS